MVEDMVITPANMHAGMYNNLVDMYDGGVGVIAIIFRLLNISTKLLLLYCGRFN